MVNIVVIGGGVNGLTCAVKIKEKYKNFRVVILSEEFSPFTTGDGSGGLWCPYLCGSTPEHLLMKWGGETYKFLHQLWLEGGHDVSLMPLYEMSRANKQKKIAWKGSVFGFRELDEKHLQYINKLLSTEYGSGRTFTTFVVTPTSLLKYMHKRFTEVNGEVVRAKVNALGDPILEQFDIVINCSGLGAKFLVPDDKMKPLRGQILKVSAPWVNITVSDEDTGHYIIPNATTCVLGGTHQENDYNRRVNIKDTEFILNGCTRMIPSLKHAEILKEWVGLRPFRTEVRLEAEKRDGKLYIHNYGHGGSGLTLFWGCASDVLRLLEENISDIDTYTHVINAKL